MAGTRSAVSRRAIIGSGRLLPMDGPTTGATGVIDGPWLLIVEEGRVAEVRAGALRAGDPELVEDVGSALVTPGLVDSHTHLIYAGDRSDEAAARSRGERYTGGGILRTVAATVAAGDDELVRETRRRLRSARASGTTTIEVKSGYGLEWVQELPAPASHRRGCRGAADARASDVPGRTRRPRRLRRRRGRPR